jgi:hypothetical protein
MTNEQQALKLILTYDMATENVQEYYQFVMGRYIPDMQKLGFELIEAWTYAYSADKNVPNRTLAFVCRSSDSMDKLLTSEQWEQLNDTLDGFVANFDFKFVPYRAGFQI